MITYRQINIFQTVVRQLGEEFPERFRFFFFFFFFTFDIFLSFFLLLSFSLLSVAVVIVTSTNLSCNSQHRDQSFVKKTVGYFLPLQSQVRFVTINSKYIALKQSAAIDYYSLHDLI